MHGYETVLEAFKKIIPHTVGSKGLQNISAQTSFSMTPQHRQDIYSQIRGNWTGPHPHQPGLMRFRWEKMLFSAVSCTACINKLILLKLAPGLLARPTTVLHRASL